MFIARTKFDWFPPIVLIPDWENPTAESRSKPAAAMAKDLLNKMEAAEEMMRAGCADYVVAQQPVLIGRTAAEMAAKLIKGQPLTKKLDEIPLVPVTKANLDTINKTTMQAPKGWTP